MFEVPQGMSLAGTLDVSAGSMLRHSYCLKFLRECRSPAQLIFQWDKSFDTVKVWGSSGNVARRHPWCFSQFNVLKPQGSRFLRESRLPAHLMIQRGQCFDTVKVWGYSGNVARRHTWCLSEVNASTQSKFEVPQGMLLVGTLDVSARWMLRYSHCLRVLRECRSMAHLMFQRGQSITRQSLRFLRECCSLEYLKLQRVQCFNTVKVWDSSGNVARRHIWCFSEVNA